uniref:Carn_acyltransf domain-containing protein n=1 Tax=Rhabditophanes sp. KR3021 TaxID=114890 RepID=A0AC35TUD1_9BILA
MDTEKYATIDTVADAKRFRRTLESYELSFRNKCFPLRPEWLIYFTLAIGVLNLFDVAPMNTFINNLSSTMTIYFGFAFVNTIFAVTVVGVFLSVAAVYLFRFLFSIMLYYQGWMYEPIGKSPSVKTKVFFTIIQFVYSYATFFSYKKVMPWLLIPAVKDTLQKYLCTIRPLVDDEEYDNFVSLAKDFEMTTAPNLQNKLWMKWLSSPNYVTDWWKELVYMRNRTSLIHTNVACGDVTYELTPIQAARAANVTLIRMKFVLDAYKKQTMRPMTMGGVPLCPVQYLEQYRTIRLPREESDIMVKLNSDSRHIAVYSKGVWYKLDIFYGNRLLRPAELEKAIQDIIDNEETASGMEDKISCLTAGSRELWAKIRREKFGKGINKESLSIIENALEIVFLDDQEWKYDDNDPESYAKECAKALTGDGIMLWCDKVSVQYFSKNGRKANNAEHSPVDAMIYVHIREYIKMHEEYISTYLEDGHCRGIVEAVPRAQRLKWNLDTETEMAIIESYTISKGITDDFVNSYEMFKIYGKNFIKKAKVSPDAYIQMAMQMAYFKDQGKFELTYEPAVMRMFKEGRTETVRSCSVESCDFVRSMLDNKSNDKERLILLQKACEGHQKYYRDAMTGKGVDRHLFGMYVVSKYYAIQHDFLDKVFKMNYALSTSQTPQHQMTEHMKTLNNNPKLFWPAGGFCCPDGSNYGVCYTVGTVGDCLSFHVAGWKHLKHTNVHRFSKHIIESLLEMKAMILNAQ